MLLTIAEENAENEEPAKNDSDDEFLGAGLDSDEDNQFPKIRLGSEDLVMTEDRETFLPPRATMMSGMEAVEINDAIFFSLSGQNHAPIRNSMTALKPLSSSAIDR